MDRANKTFSKFYFKQTDLSPLDFLKHFQDLEIGSQNSRLCKGSYSLVNSHFFFVSSRNSPMVERSVT